ncbi:MAG: tRNA pseudouridine(38-40) synthase TruA [Anaerolineaceae bacterium]|nr:tRNA pseudouridine(38-40) synthase TruA [Anaerolineaceae bacterium]MBN2676523.1 tRNA pseudouridine(38-40) synthase TruA [Anaerolineaceae bacterium]
MARYKAILRYDGTHFAGFQRQAQTRTVQSEFERALRKLGWQGVSILAAGRTDTGVHASGQVIAFDIDWPHPTQSLLKALNTELPEDMAVSAVDLTPADFHPRYMAVSRRYHYRVFCAAERNPLRERFAWRVWPEPQIQMLVEAAGMTKGVRDYTAFGAPTRPGGHTIREVQYATWHEDEDGLNFEITANAFLYHMVRRVTFIHVRIGQGLVSIDDYQQALECGKSLISGLAPPQGLALVEVIYPPGSDTLATN